MSEEKNRREAQRWLTTAQDDLGSAAILANNAQYAHACFHAQQAAEKSLKAVWIYEDADPWGHSIKRLIEGLVEVNMTAYEHLNQHIGAGMVLDRFYIPTRYPNGLPDLTPAEAFDVNDADKCLQLAKSIVSAAKQHMMTP